MTDNHTRQENPHTPDVFLTEYQDWTELIDDDTVAHSWLTNLLGNGRASLSLPLSHHLSEWLERTYVHYRQAEKLRAEKTLCFGYPFFLWQSDDGRQHLAPLLLWTCRLEPGAQNNQPTWELSVQPEYGVKPNYDWARWASQQSGEDWVGRLQTLAQAGPGAQSLSQLALALGEHPAWQAPDIQPALAALPPTAVRPPLLAGDGQLYWAAALGRWPEPLPLLDDAALQPNWQAPAPAGSQLAHPFGLAELDPWQTSLLHLLHERQYALASGSAGSGKTQVAVQLISNALSNGKTCLVIADHTSSLEQLQQRLAAHNLAGVTFSLRDAHLDRQLLLSQLAALERRPARNTDFNLSAFEEQTRKLLREKKRLDDRYHTLRHPIFGEYAWTDAVGLFLAASRRQGKEQLGSQLNAQLFAFNAEEYELLRQSIEQARPLYEALGSMTHPLNNLHAGIFLHQDVAQSQAFISGMANNFHHEALRLHSQYMRRATQYADELQQYQERYYRDLTAQLHHLDELLEDSKGEVGEELLKSSSPTLRLYGVFSGKFRDALSRQEQLRDAYRQLQEVYAQRNAFAFTWPDEKITRKPAALADTLARFGEALNQWRNELPAAIQDESLRLNSKTALSELGVSRHIAEIEHKLDDLVDAINESGLFQLPLEAKMMTLPRRQRYLEELVDKFDTIRRNLDNFPAFYAWQRHWFGLPDKCRKVISALARVKPEDWVAALDSWYFYQCLNQRYAPVLPPPAGAIERYVEQWKNLASELPNQILKTVEQRRDDQLRRLKPLLRETVAADQPPRLLWENLLSQYGAELAKAFPLWLTTSAHAATLLAQGNFSFDYLIVEDAHNLPAERGLACLGLGRQTLLLSNPEQEDPRNHLTLVAQARAGGVAVQHLDVCHRWSPGNVWQLAQGVELAPYAVGAYQLYYSQVDGRYQEDHRINEAEAQEVIRLLNLVRETPGRTYPRVGVVTLTPQQRDLITAYLLRIKRMRAPGAELIQQLERNGMGVYYLDELAGQTFDQIIVSGVYGPIDRQGTLPDILEDWSSSAGRARLAALLGIPRQEIRLLSSLPKEQLAGWLAQSRPGLGALAAFFLYVRAADLADVAEQTHWVNALRSLAQPESNPLDSDSPLFAEMALRLATYFPEARLTVLDRWQKLRVPLLIQAPDAKPVGIIADGFIAQTNVTSYTWEWAYRQELQQSGLLIHAISAQDWWKNPAQETIRLAGIVRGLQMGATGEEEE